MTDPVHTTAAGDYYLSIANLDPANETVAISVFATPLIVWIWIAVLLMGFGGLVSLIPSRRRAMVARRETVVAGAAETA